MQHDDGVSSISGSDSDSDEDADTSRLGSQAAASTSQRSAEVIFASGDQVFKVWRALLHPDQRHGEPDRALLADRLLEVRRGSGHWVVLLSRGGHFAATIFNVSAPRRSGNHEAPPYEVVVHKTFHRYVVRAKAGGRQSAKDATGKSIKSAGSALRRHNEVALERDIQDTLQSWKDKLKAAALIFVHAPSSNAAALFGGEHPAMDRGDARVRSVPFTTRRPTFTETKRVLTTLLSVQAAELPPTPSAGASATPSKAKAPKEIARKEKSAGPAVVEPPVAPAIPDSGLHVAAKAGDAAKVTQLLEGGEDPTALDARGRPPYAVAADKDVRDAFRRYMAGSDAQDWDWAAAGVPSALTPEMEAQQAARQAEKKAKLREREKERKKRASERKSRAAEESRAAAEAEVSSATAEAAALAARCRLPDL
ncbi:hypothetical protein COCSUDRAFT_83632 [Coccomyxa subellipsoidea C-169]|uniref:VLRF1 domain-containing protein n=1 Tax=Coccomyxa subellipsoidea (strain C-169) TaxID=574566 RepID=I0Z4Q6_COCSC|nr:hypothetical protein COCSUDRAFT_83632 [Coccomyxa subellipsoidea C-169]EIE25625.1 hypothetical protein COCSUDRAFT_83632 [Coccomyxa subellipsoidea C-169]|eukprot:XP_005650169.1 hypothetical protein COCSUDRAFT_83632 [Coccomyxa subellipsoidea C-169]